MKFDLHCHTKYSQDSLSTPEQVVKAAKKMQLNGIAFTDHNNATSWQFISGLEKKYGLQIIKGEEIKINMNGKFAGELLAYFMNEPVTKTMEIQEALDALREQDAIIALSHPFRDNYNFFGQQKKWAKRVDALETINGHLLATYRNDANEMAKALAHELYMQQIGGSDAHLFEEIGMAYTETDEDIFDALKKNKCTAKAGKKLNLFEKIKTSIVRKIVE